MRALVQNNHEERLKSRSGVEESGITQDTCGQNQDEKLVLTYQTSTQFSHFTSLFFQKDKNPTVQTDVCRFDL